MTQKGLTNAFALSPDAKYLATGNTSGVITIWETTTGQIFEQIRQDEQNFIYDLEFSPDGRRIASAGEGGSVRVLEVQTAKEIARMHGSGVVYSAAFSPDGGYVISESTDGLSRMWDAATGEEVADITGYVLAFSPSTPYAAIFRVDRTVAAQIYRPEDMAQEACQRLIRNLTHAEWQEYIGDALPYQAVCENLPVGS